MDHHEQIQLDNCLWLDAFARQAALDRRLLRHLLKRWPDPGKLRQASPAEIAEAMPNWPAQVSRVRSALRDSQWPGKAASLAEEAFKLGVRAVFCSEPSYPSRLREISGCPLALYYRGLYQEIFARPHFVTVIGTRESTAYGRIVAEKITAGLADCGIAIISGMARGIDSVAHRTCLQRGGFTVAVLGNGPDIPYPPENGRLLQEIAASGLVVSEHPPGTPPRKQHFPARNRILSGLADAVAVIEASRSSGSLITASFAADQGRDVFAVPGSILALSSLGCNHLIRDGAYVLLDADDILWRLPAGSLQTRIERWLKQGGAADAPGLPADESDGPVERQVLQRLAGGDQSLAELAVQLGRSLESMAVVLTGMELAGDLSYRRGRYTLTENALCSI